MKPDSKLSRRRFVHSTSAGLMVLSSRIALGTEANSALALGLIGCGGRGHNDAGKLRKIEPVRLVALADPFEDRLEAARQWFGDDNPAAFLGLGSYQKVLQSDIDAVVITSPPFFHPEHFATAVDAGKHIYLEKPVSVDTAGAQRVLQAGKKAEGRQSVMVGFQTRFNPDMQEAVRRVHEGAIGEIACGDGFYHSGKLGPQSKPGMPPLEARIRDWLFDKVLSGDILVEQNIHVIDVCNWIMKTHPASARGSGGQKVRTSYGNTWDHYEVTYQYPGEVPVVFFSTQFMDLGWGDVGERFNGSKGAFDAHAKPMQIRGENPWAPPQPSEKKDEALFQAPEAEERKFQAFVDSILKKEYVNEVAQGVESTLTAILGRTAAYRGKEVTWEEMLTENEELIMNL